MMKFNALLSLGSVLLLPVSHAALVSLWTLDDTSSGVAVDSINGNNATWQNGTNTNLANAAGLVGGAADLTDAGGNNYFQLNIPQLIGANALSISVWINNRNQSSNAYNGIFMTRTFNGQTNNSWGIAIENNGDERLDSRVDGPGLDSPNGLLADDGTWKHLVLVYDAVTKTHTHYVNGNQEGTISVAGDAGLGATIVGPDSGPWYIGYDNCCGDNRDFDGAIDDISVWDNALTAGEVSALYTNGLAGIGAGAIPEPGTSSLALLAGLGLIFRRRKA